VKLVITGASGAITCPNSNCAGGTLARIAPLRMTITAAGLMRA